MSESKTGLMRNSKSRLLDIDIRPILKNELRERFSGDSIIREEFGCNGARVDIAVINGRLHGFEIKSDRDSLDRLVTQVPIYSALFDSMTIVVGSKYRESVQTCIPSWWGIKEARRLADGRIALLRVRPANDNDGVDPCALIRLLWRKEIWAILRKHKHHSDLRNASAFRLQKALNERLSADLIAKEVRSAIKVRLASESDSPQTRNDGSYPTASTAEDSRAKYEANLLWLLTLQSRHPLR
jgi:hypothetical protein